MNFFRFKFLETVLFVIAAGGFGATAIAATGNRNGAAPVAIVEDGTPAPEPEDPVHDPDDADENDDENVIKDFEALDDTDADLEEDDSDMDEWDDDEDPLVQVLIENGVELDAFEAAIDRGQPIIEWAEENRIDLQIVIDALMMAELAEIDELLDAGEITRDEAAEWRNELEAHVTFQVSNPYPEPVRVAANAIGVDLDTLFDVIDSGRSLEELAAETGVDPQAVIDAIRTSQIDYVQAMVDAGLIDPEELSEIQAEIEQLASEIVTQPWEMDEAEENEEAEDEDDSDEAHEDESETEMGEARDPEDEEEGDGDSEPATSLEQLLIKRGLDPELLEEALNSGRSIAELAEANHIDLQEVIAVMMVEEEAEIAALLAEGEITEEDAAAWRIESEAYLAFIVQNPEPVPMVEVAKAIGIELEALIDRLDSGQTVEAIAAENGVDPQAVIDAVLNDQIEYAQAMIEAGLLEVEAIREVQHDAGELALNVVTKPVDQWEVERIGG